MKSIILVLITVFCAATSAGRPGIQSNMKFECKGTSSYHKARSIITRQDNIYGVITGCSDGLQEEIELVVKKLERIFKQDIFNMIINIKDIQNDVFSDLKKQQEKERTSYMGLQDEVDKCRSVMTMDTDEAFISGCGKGFQNLIKDFFREVRRDIKTLDQLKVEFWLDLEGREGPWTDLLTDIPFSCYKHSTLC